MMPCTWAPTSTAACGSSVPVALMVANRSPRFTGAVRKLGPLSAPALIAQTPRPAVARTAKASIILILVSCMESSPT